MGRNSNTSDASNEASAFLKKTYAILMDKKNRDIVSWSPCGTKFSILDHERFSEEILPQHFKHNNPKSFVRQLNIHGFKKIGPKTEKGRDYYNENFRRGKPELMDSILRISVKHRDDKSETEHQEVEILRLENEALKKKITSLEQSGPANPVAQTTKHEDMEEINLLLQLYKKMKALSSSDAKFDSPEIELGAKLQDLLENIKSLKSSQSPSNSETWKDDSSLGKRSTHSVMSDNLDSELNYDQNDTLTWFNTEFKEETFALREFTFDLDN